jgi:hypothetical protein
LDQIDDVWDHYFNQRNDAGRVDFGAIFEEYGISPHPEGASPIDVSISRLAPPPTFQWQRGNNNANDAFQLLVFNSDLSQRVLDIAIPGDVTSYTLSDVEWGTLGSMSGDFRFTIAGSDTTDFATGAYWSDAYLFTVTSTGGPNDPVLPGDYNEDGVVNAADYVVWRNHEGQAYQLPNEDPTATPGSVTPEDYGVWVANFGNTAGGGSASVPEPATVLLFVLGSAAVRMIGIRSEPRRRLF